MIWASISHSVLSDARKIRVEYLRTAGDYVHPNPVRAGLLKVEERLRAYPWSSFGAYLAAAEHRPGWIRGDRLLGEHSILRDTPEGRQETASAAGRPAPPTTTS